LLALVAAVGAGSGWYLHLVRKQRSAVHAIRARSRIVDYDYRFDAIRERRHPNGKSWCPNWLRQFVVGDDFFHNAVMAGLDVDKSGQRTRPTDADLAHFAGLRHLKLQYLGGGGITDAGLEHLKNLTDLRLLILWGNPISGAGLKHLRSLGKLRHLDLNNSAVSDDQLTHLKYLTGLERIDLANNPQLTGSFLQHVAELPNLRELVLRGSGITGSALIHLEHARNLQSLMLDRTRVTDAGRPHLRRLASLRSPDLSQSGVTHAGIAITKVWAPQATVKP
jgi:hypothetical protein